MSVVHRQAVRRPRPAARRRVAIADRQLTRLLGEPTVGSDLQRRPAVWPWRRRRGLHGQFGESFRGVAHQRGVHRDGRLPGDLDGVALLGCAVDPLTGHPLTGQAADAGGGFDADATIAEQFDSQHGGRLSARRLRVPVGHVRGHRRRAAVRCRGRRMAAARAVRGWPRARRGSARSAPGCRSGPPDSGTPPPASGRSPRSVDW